MHGKSSSVKHTTRTSKTEERHEWCSSTLVTVVFVTMRTVALQGYLNVVGVDVIWAHNIGIGVLQDDPGVVDLSWWERERKQDVFDELALWRFGWFMTRQWEDYREECSCICFCSYSQVSGPPLGSSSPLPPTFEESAGERQLFTLLYSILTLSCVSYVLIVEAYF